jgi:hypothetical protein
MLLPLKTAYDMAAFSSDVPKDVHGLPSEWCLLM